jgi:uncharacterized repeat protein (TIGR03837 family)
VIEAFACNPPENYVEASLCPGGRRDSGKRKNPGGCWINLEYLSAENWVAGCHGMASPHPRLPLTKYFFFPGFTPETGGLLRERDLLVRQAAFRTRDALLARLGLTATPDTLLVSLFCYDNAPLAPLLAAWRDDDAPLLCLVLPGKPLAAVRACLGSGGWHDGGLPFWNLGNARVVPIPFLSQDAYDELLLACDLNFVRGEDSFARAQWAGQPFVWQAYPQDDVAHLQKLAAFLDLYRLDPRLVRFWRAWNGGDAASCQNIAVRQDWFLLRQALPQLYQHNMAWRAKLAGQDDLASALVKFCAARV